MAYKVGKYLKTSEEYVGGIDPLAKAVQDFPSILARNQAYAVQKRDQRESSRNDAANKILDESMENLSVQMDIDGEEYKSAEDALSYFKDFYKDDPLMLSYSQIHEARLNRFNQRKEVYEKNIEGIDVAQANIKSKLSNAYQTDELEQLLDSMKKRYTESEQEFTQGEQTQYTNMINELDTAIETYRGLMGATGKKEYPGLKLEAGKIPKDHFIYGTPLDYAVDEEGNRIVREYEADSSLANDDEYQATLDQSWAAIQNGDYAQAQKLFNTAQSNKIVAEGRFKDIQRGIDSYYIDNQDFDKNQPESEINPKRIINPNISSIKYDIQGFETGALDLLLSAEQFLSSDDLDGAESVLRRIPKSAADSQRRALLAIETEVGKQKSVIDEKYDNILGDIVTRVSNKGYDKSVEGLLKELKATGKIDGGATKTGLFALPERQAKTRKAIIDIIENGKDWKLLIDEPAVKNEEAKELFRLIDTMNEATPQGKWNNKTGDWDSKPKELIREDIFKYLSEGENAKNALNMLDWSGHWLDDDTENEEMSELLQELIEVEEFSRPLSERADRYNNEILRYATGR